ncbi:di-heme oxidoredictase family protein [Rubricoccus marinus]|uniref:Cytochrome c domain-containing protein n=1 Tax=Rubricoccus marinus TaxID=716817 RepID=A0A259U0J3_9BACT|nr:di-heme oxidoredictase family protein [Rubricoccus marinus]OZC03543.1 hypothetical protein BSZ36_11460 [Rubricoccus marinus]
MRVLALLALAVSLAACDSAAPSGGAEPLAGGATTVFDASGNGFSTPAPNLSAGDLALHLVGDAEFEATFVTAPAPVNGGLGPVFNNTSCIACHARDGRSRESLLLRVSQRGRDLNGGPLAADGFGLQVQDRAILGHQPEGTVQVAWTERREVLSDGTVVSLREPAYTIGRPLHALPSEVSPRFSRPVFGLGLLEAVRESDLYALARAQEAGGEVSGRPNVVWDPIEGRMRVGRFGWKANQPSLISQTVTAYSEDMGVSSPWALSASGEAEIDRETVEAVTFYTQTLGVPARRGVLDPMVVRGERLFASVGCASCHAPELRTGSQTGVAAVSNQTIRPYTDLLLHDMGPALADGRPDFGASGSEWRTPPLWGLGLTRVVNGAEELMHDGRARGVVEAVMWHGGEAEAARERFRALSREERDALLAFLRSL